MRKELKIFVLLAMVSILVIAVAGCTSSSQTDTPAASATPAPTNQTITDSFGNKVTVPITINRIVDGWPAHNEVVAMLGDREKIVGTNTVDQALPWFAKIYPNITKIPAPVTSTTLNVETVLQCNPDIVILSTGFNASTAQIQQYGIPVVTLTFTTFDQLKQCFVLTGTILGPNELAKANQYNAYLDSKLTMLNSTTSTIPSGEKLKVLHAMSLNPLKVDGNNTLIDSWIQAAGGINAAGADISGNGQAVTIEQVLKWNPDVIIIGGTMKDLATVKNDTKWAQLKAVQNNRVYINPKGVFNWDRYGAEEALQIQWAARTLYPEKFQSIDIRKETRDFYQTYFNYSLTDSDLDSIISPQV